MGRGRGWGFPKRNRSEISGERHLETFGLAAKLLGLTLGFDRWRIDHVANARLHGALRLVKRAARLALSLAACLLGGAFSFKRVVADELARAFLQAALDLVASSCYDGPSCWSSRAAQDACS